MVAEFRRRRDVIVAGLNRLPGVTCLQPHGAFYAFPNVRAVDPDCRPARRTTCCARRASPCSSGTAFGAQGRGFLRFSYANSVEAIEEALTPDRRGARALTRRGRGA